MIEFPEDIWKVIMSFFHSAYKKPLHLCAIDKFIKVYKQTQSECVIFIDGNHKIYIDNTIYRYMLDDFTFYREPLILYNKRWNPFMSRYCFLSMVTKTHVKQNDSLTDVYKKCLFDDYKKILRDHYLPSKYYSYH